MFVSFHELKNEFKRVLLKHSFTDAKADICATLFAENSRDGVYSHGLNRFPDFIQSVKEGIVDPTAEPECLIALESIEHWTGNFGAGMYNANLAMGRAIEIAKQKGLGLVTLKNNNHWMRGGSYGWQAADKGCIGISTTNTIANMPPWGGVTPTLGNNPIVIAVPRTNGEHLILDMAVSQYSYGALQEFEFNNRKLQEPGGYDGSGELSYDPAAILHSRRILPIGFWKGSGLSLIIDALLNSLSGGRTTAQITAEGKERGVSQLFLCIYQPQLNYQLCDEIIGYAKSSRPVEEGGMIKYPGENTMATRKQNLRRGISVNEEIWRGVQRL